MYTFRLSKTLISTQESDWSQLVEEQLGKDIHPNRARGFCLAREALRECFAEYGDQLSIKDLVLENFGQLKNHPFKTLSLSHTTDWGAAVLGKSTDYRSLGIDIEPLERVVKPMILARISHPEDLDLSPIHLWALKEAVFKALMNTAQFEAPVEFSSIKISDAVWSHSPSGNCGEWKIEYQDGLIVALAWIRT